MAAGSGFDACASSFCHRQAQPSAFESRGRALALAFASPKCIGRNHHSAPLPDGMIPKPSTPVALPYRTLQRLSSTSQRRAPLGCRPCRRGGAKRLSLNLSECVLDCSWYIGARVGRAKAPLFSRDRRRNRKDIPSFSASVDALQTAIKLSDWRQHPRREKFSRQPPLALYLPRRRDSG
jgi:hypothetical protein